MPDLVELTQELCDTLTPASWDKRLSALNAYKHLNIKFSSSLSLEDQAITHVIATENLPIDLFTLDTGRLFEETHDVFSQTVEKYPNIRLKAYYPDASSVENLVQDQGINGFRDSIEKRKACCHVRKVEPLNRALDGAHIWISGLRQEHSANRADLPVAEYDAGRNIVKFYPLIDVTAQNVDSYIKTHEIPYNILHDRHYPSIGCAPCTRAITAGEDMRAGRWWWENESAQECGLHMVDGRLVRAKDLKEAQ